MRCFVPEPLVGQVHHTLENYEWLVSQHAAERWCERVGNTTDTWAARTLIQISVQGSLTIPNRLATPRWVLQPDENLTGLSRRQGIRYRISGVAVFVTGGHRVITVLRATEDDLAMVLVWLMTREWCP